MNRGTRLSRAGFCLLGIGLAVFAATPVPAGAQMLYGGLVGNVVDAQGAVVPGASVTIVNKDTNLTRETTTDAQGGYSFTNIQAGPYDVKVILTGFKESVRSRVPVSTGQISRVDLTLAVGNLTESVTVQSEAELLQTDKADVHTELKFTEITNLRACREAPDRDGISILCHLAAYECISKCRFSTDPRSETSLEILSRRESARRAQTSSARWPGRPTCHRS